MVFPLFCCDTWCADCCEDHRTENDKGETIHSEENMITRQLKEFSTQEVISQPPDELCYGSLYCKMQET